MDSLDKCKPIRKHDAYCTCGQPNLHFGNNLAQNYRTIKMIVSQKPPGNPQERQSYYTILKPFTANNTLLCLLHPGGFVQFYIK
jgi:hypothetical protein